MDYCIFFKSGTLKFYLATPKLNTTSLDCEAAKSCSRRTQNRCYEPTHSGYSGFSFSTTKVLTVRPQSLNKPHYTQTLISNKGQAPNSVQGCPMNMFPSEPFEGAGSNPLPWLVPCPTAGPMGFPQEGGRPKAPNSQMSVCVATLKSAWRKAAPLFPRLGHSINYNV